MEQLLYILPALACPVGMGLMMWFMMRGKGKSEDSTPDQQQELARLRAQIDAMRPVPAPFEARHPAPALGKNASA